MDQFPKVYRDFHPKDPAHGMRNYDIGALNKRQIRKLNRRKAIDRDENEIYLKNHPEIKGLISILLRHILWKRPGTKHVHEIIGEFFNRTRRQIVLDLYHYFSHAKRLCNFENELPASTNTRMGGTKTFHFNM